MLRFARPVYLKSLASSTKKGISRSAGMTRAIPIHALLYREDLFHTNPLTSNSDSGDVAGEKWIALGGRHLRLPDRTAYLHYNDQNPRYSDPSDQLWHPDWYCASKEYLAYVPDSVSYELNSDPDKPALSWPHEPYSGLALLTPEECERFSDGLEATIESDIEKAREIMDRLEDRGGLPWDLVSVPDVFIGLKDPTEPAELAAQLVQLRLDFLAILGAISYSLAHVDNATREILTQTRSCDFKRWLILDAPKLGVLVDPLDVNLLEKIPFVDLLRSGCPIYYPADAQYRPVLTEAQASAASYVNESNFTAVFACTCNAPEYLKRPAFPGVTIPPNNETQEVTASLERTSLHDEEPPPTLATKGHGTATPTSTRITAMAYAPRQDCDLFGRLSDAYPDSVEGWLFRLQRLQESAERTLSSCFSLTRPVLASHPRAESIRWDAAMLEEGCLALDAVTEVKLRTWSLLHRNCLVRDLLHEALARGMALHIVYSPRAMGIRNRLEPDERVLARRFDLGLTEAGHNLPALMDARAAFDLYRARVTALLARPHAVAFLAKGGILARVAKHFAGPNLVARFAHGPSAWARVIPCSELGGIEYVQDYVEPLEIDLLLGRTDDTETSTRSWFPSQQLLDYAGVYFGEWTQENELWFSDRFRAIDEGTVRGRPLTNRQWTSWLRHHFRRRLTLSPRAFDIPPPDAVEALRADFDGNLGSWTGIRLHDTETDCDYRAPL